MRAFVFITCLLLTVHAHGFKVYEVLIHKDLLESFANSESILSAADGEAVIIKSYAELQQTSAHSWLVDQTYPLEYVEKIEPDGTVISATRDVGLRVKIKQRGDNSYDLYYNHSKLLKWLPFTKHYHLQPIFNTIKLNPKAVTIKDEAIMGGLHIGDHVQYFIIMRM